MVGPSISGGSTSPTGEVVVGAVVVVMTTGLGLLESVCTTDLPRILSRMDWAILLARSVPLRLGCAWRGFEYVWDPVWLLAEGFL